MKPHVCRMPGGGKVWYVFNTRAQRDATLDELRRGVHDNRRRHDAVTWGITPEHALRHYRGIFE